VFKGDSGTCPDIDSCAGASGELAGGFIGSAFGRTAALLVLVGLMAIAISIGIGRWR
jgi:hypothetical protein